MTPGRGTDCACTLKRQGQEAPDSSLAGKKEKNNPGQMVQKKLKDQQKKKKKKEPLLPLEKEIYS